jgi:hypothetical protein
LQYLSINGTVVNIKKMFLSSKTLEIEGAFTVLNDWRHYNFLYWEHRRCDNEKLNTSDQKSSLNA